MAFKMGRVRDLVGILKSSLRPKLKIDPVASLIKDMEEFDLQFTNPDTFTKKRKRDEELFKSIVTKLLATDHSKLLEIVRDFNTRGEHAEIAQKVL